MPNGLDANGLDLLAVSKIRKMSDFSGIIVVDDRFYLYEPIMNALVNRNSRVFWICLDFYIHKLIILSIHSRNLEKSKARNDAFSYQNQIGKRK